jgi:glycosyltransferase involved in cell wall biosynthesis
MAPQLCREFPRLRFLWVGDGLLREYFEHRIAEMGLADRFILTGLVPPGKVPEVAAAMDVLVHPSRREGLARALPQGSLAGKPVVTYDVDGNREALVDGHTGFLVPPFDRHKLAQSLRVLLADPGLRRSMGEAGRAFALGRFDASVMVDALERVYREAESRAKVR